MFLSESGEACSLLELNPEKWRKKKRRDEKVVHKYVTPSHVKECVKAVFARFCC